MRAGPRGGAAALLLAASLLLAGCSATPVGVRKADPRQAYQTIRANPLNSGVPDGTTRFVLNRYFLLEKWEEDPAGTIANLHDVALRDDRRDVLYALAELSYLHAGTLQESWSAAKKRLASDYFLLSALYAYYYALGSGGEASSSAFDLRFRTACDLYNFGLWQGLGSVKGSGEVDVAEGVRALPFGRLSIALDPSRLPGGMEDYAKFEASDRWAVRGVSVVNRTPGVGLPLIGIRKGEKRPTAGGRAVAVTAFLRVEGGISALREGARATLEFHSPHEDDTVEVNGRTVPLESDTTTPLAYMLEGSDTWSLGTGVMTFLGKERGALPGGLYQYSSYRPGKIPVVLVHGTASSPVWWSEMLNTLSFYPEIRRKYQFWFFVYTSGKPIVFSAADLRDALRSRVASLDPGGKDPALRQMVVVGHSQGGLLTRLTSVQTGDRLQLSLTGKPLESLDLTEERKEEVRRLLYVEPLPFVTRVVFLATPHRGSFRTAWWNRSMARALVQLPANLFRSGSDYYRYLKEDAREKLGVEGSVVTSADGMSPENPLLEALVESPAAPWVSSHSIIAVQTEGDPKLGNDGVVEYRSAHLDDVKSEFVVRSGHSCQQNPAVIDEVRRILVEHLAATTGK